MAKILIATHGYLAQGVKNTIHLLIGENVSIQCICAYVDESNLEEKIAAFMHELLPQEQALIFTDINGGSINQKILFYREKKNVFIISGFNLSLVLELILLKEQLTPTIINKKIQMCREQMVLVNELSFESLESDEDFFQERKLDND